MVLIGHNTELVGRGKGGRIHVMCSVKSIPGQSASHNGEPIEHWGPLLHVTESCSLSRRVLSVVCALISAIIGSQHYKCTEAPAKCGEAETHVTSSQVKKSTTCVRSNSSHIHRKTTHLSIEWRRRVLLLDSLFTSCCTLSTNTCSSSKSPPSSSVHPPSSCASCVSKLWDRNPGSNDSSRPAYPTIFIFAHIQTTSE